MEIIQDITHGFFVNRLKRKGDVWKKIRLLNMQDVAYFTGNQVLKPSEVYMDIYDSDKDSILIGHKGDIVLGRTMGYAMVIDNDFDGCLVNSNFVLIKIHKNHSPYFLVWYINESHAFKKYLAINQQGSTTTKVLSVTDLKAFNYQSVNKLKEDIIGKIYKLQIQRKILMAEQSKLETMLLNEEFNIFRKKEK